MRVSQLLGSFGSYEFGTPSPVVPKMYLEGSKKIMLVPYEKLYPPKRNF